jgi:t-SNARE complex subunit (syntaxin)
MRQKELEEIKKVSSQVLGMTVAMSVEVNKQSGALGTLEDNIIDVKVNALKAEADIKEAEKMTRSTKRKIMWLFLCLCIVIIAIIAILLCVFLPKSDS